MKVIEAGHIYELTVLDGDNPVIIRFVNREGINNHDGTQVQEVLRAVVDTLDVLNDRTNHCDSCMRWESNDKIIKHFTEAQRQLRLALLLHENRAMERKIDKVNWKPELVSTQPDGHFDLPK